MKKVFFILLIWSTAACAQGELVSREGKLGEEYEMKSGHKRVYELEKAQAQAPVVLEVENFKNDFCPPNARCIRWGEAFASVRLIQGEEVVETEFCLGDCNTRDYQVSEVRKTPQSKNVEGYDEQIVELNSVTYKVSLVGYLQNEQTGVFKLEVID